MKATKIDYTMEKYDEENVELMLENLGFDTDNYFIAVTKQNLLKIGLIGNSVEFSNRSCIISFAEKEISLIMLSAVTNKKVTQLIRINRSDITKTKLSDTLFSYTLKTTLNDTTIKFQIPKKVAQFTKIKSSFEEFRKLYNI